MKQTLKILLLSFCSIAFFNSVAASSQVMTGPPMICGKKTDLMSHAKIYKETQFMVFQEERTNEKAYFVLHRNAKTGTWTFIAYNIPDAPPGIICVLHGGMASYILPNIEEIKKMLKKQDSGFDEPVQLEAIDKAT